MKGEGGAGQGPRGLSATFANYRTTISLSAQSKMGSFSCHLRQGPGRPLLDSRGGSPAPTTAAPKPPAPYSQHVVPEAALPLSLVEEVVEVAAEGDEHKAKGQEAKNACGGTGVGQGVTNPRYGSSSGEEGVRPLRPERQLSSG